MINVNMAALLQQFNKEYEFLYTNGDESVCGYNEALNAFEGFSRKHHDIVTKFARCRNDFIMSDREAAAFMFAISVVCPALC